MEKDEDEETFGTKARDTPSALCQVMIKHPTQHDEIIEIEDDDDRSSEEQYMQYLDLQDEFGKGRDAPARRNSSAKRYPPRNPPVVDPFKELENFKYGDLLLRKGKSVELQDGDFLRVKAIVGNSKDDQVLLRGHRLQRCSSMNGMLEKKLNELCLFYEVDLDDPREVLEQSIVEIPVSGIKKLRNIRWTNQQFPKDRNVTISDYQNQQDVASDGGLTVRWKYTCRYASAEHRHRNDYVDRTLEHICTDDLPVPTALSDEMRRFEWRGETIPGGSYRPQAISKDSISGSILHAKGPAIIHGGTPDPDSPIMIIRSRSSSIVEAGAPKKRKYDRVQQSDSTFSSVTHPKKTRHEEDNIRETTEKVKKICLKYRNVEVRRVSFQLDHESRSRPVIANPIPSLIERTMSSGQYPQYEGIRCPSPVELVSRARRHGQMFTYGDAFCGAGGTTRGAFMAGLRVKWGFDFNKHACETWRANFPLARCYTMAAHQFVQLAQRAERNGFPEIMKVDILHLSPPCQYFSDAHTVNGKDDEMNTASLFAVRDIIEVAKPRIVTLEQTFGITRSKFMWYLSALIQMFTSLDFSIRWAVVQLAQWGLPQSRRRLIIIAACPGEILPEIPPPTHSSQPSDGLKPFATINQTISQIPLGSPDHDPESTHQYNGRAMPSYDGNAILPRAMTCSGGQNYHPSGERDFTIREYASLQGFPPNHLFRGNYIKKQIGNAVPPSVAKILFESIKRALDQANGIVEEHEVMVIDES